LIDTKKERSKANNENLGCKTLEKLSKNTLKFSCVFEYLPRPSPIRTKEESGYLVVQELVSSRTFGESPGMKKGFVESIYSCKGIWF